MDSARRLRVLMLNYEYPPLGGGGGVVTRDLAESMAGKADVTVLTSHRKGLERDARLNGVRVVRTPVLLRKENATASLPSMLSYFPSSLKTGRRLLEAEPFDLVHSFFAVPSAPSGVLLARRAGLPHVLSIMGGDIYDPTKRLSPHKTPLLKQTVRWAMRRSVRVVAESKDIAARAEEYYGVEGVERIPHGYQPFEFRACKRTELGLGLEDEHCVLVAVGRLVARKGLEQLVEIVAGIPDPGVRLLIVGDGPMRGPLQAQARELGAEGRILFPGFVAEELKWQILSNSDAFVYTTLHEGFGIVYLEAMATGLPVVTYDCGGQTDFLTDEIAFLVPVGNKEKFRESLLRLIREPELREKMSRTALGKAKEFEVDSIADAYLDLYRECLDRYRRAS